MVKKTVVGRKYFCPRCGKAVKYAGKLFGQSSKPCPHCGHTVMHWMFDSDYRTNFRVAGGTGAAKNPRKYEEN